MKSHRPVRTTAFCGRVNLTFRSAKTVTEIAASELGGPQHARQLAMAAVTKCEWKHGEWGFPRRNCGCAKALKRKSETAWTKEGFSWKVTESTESTPQTESPQRLRIAYPLCPL